MSNSCIYLDNASTTLVIPEAAQAIMDNLLHNFGNPSSLHKLGLQAAQKLKESREVIATALSVSSSEIYFTSGGTEANNIAILGSIKHKRKKGRHCVTTSIEHQSVLSAFKMISEEGWEVSYLPVNSNGVIDPESLAKALRNDTVLVSVMHVNNEIGSVQPIREIGRILAASKSRPLFHVDAVQSFCKYNVKPTEWGAHLVSLSAHKIHAAKGTGALYINKAVKLDPLFYGGQQEGGVRAGTENVHGAAGMAEAVKVLKKNLDVNKSYVYKLKKLFYEELKKDLPVVQLIGPSVDDGAFHILSVSIPPVPAEVFQRALSSKGIYVGIGAACSSGKSYVSHVLKAIGVERQLADSAIRISLSITNTEEQIKKAVWEFKQCYEQLCGSRSKSYKKGKQTQGNLSC